MKRTLFIILLGLALTACGGGGSDANDAAKPPAPEAPQNPGNGNGNGNGGGGNGAEEPDPELSLSCSGSPNLGTVEPNAKATATFNFSQTYNGAAEVVYGLQGGIASLDNVFVNGNQLVVTRDVPAEGKYVIQLNVNGTGLTASCSWIIAEKLGLAI